MQARLKSQARAYAGLWSGGELEQFSHEDWLGLHVATADLSNLSLPYHRHRLVASQGSSGGSEAAKAEPRPGQAFDPPMVLFRYGVQVLALPQPGPPPQFAAAASRLAESRQSMVRPRPSTARYRQVQRPLVLMEVSSTRHEPLHVRRCGLSRFSNAAGVGLDPAEDGRVVDLHAPIRQHQFEVAVTHREHQIPADRPQDHLPGEMPPLELRPPLRPCPLPRGRSYPGRNLSPTLQQNPARSLRGIGLQLRDACRMARFSTPRKRASVTGKHITDQQVQSCSPLRTGARRRQRRSRPVRPVRLSRSSVVRRSQRLPTCSPKASAGNGRRRASSRLTR